MLAHVKEKHPWFWVFKSFISSRPNVVETGVGNNSTGYNVSILQRGGLSDRASSEPLEVENFEGTNSESIADDWHTTQDGGDDEGDEGEDNEGGKQSNGDEDGADDGGSKVGDKQ